MSVYTPTKSSETDSEAGNMKIVCFGNEFPKDDLLDHFRQLHNHSKDKGHSILAQFLNEATRVVKEEIRILPTELKQLIPPFDTLITWAENDELREGLLCGAIDGVVLIVLQIAAYIGHYEDQNVELGDCSSTCLAGLGIGLLSSAAAALSPTLARLPLAGGDAVRLAFRLGVHVLGVSENLEARDLSEKPETWAYVVHNVDAAAAQKELDSLYPPQKLPNSGKIFISAISQTSVTVSGPPSRLKALFNKSGVFRTARSIALPVFGGLCHAPHVYDDGDVASIVQDSSLATVLAESSPITPLYSTSTGLPYPADTAVDLFKHIVAELLTRAICWDNVVGGLVDRARGLDASSVAVFCFGNSISVNDLNKSLQSTLPNSQVQITNLMSWISKSAPRDQTPRATSQSKLAIVGMSCRLPGGATSNEKFWEILEKGLDVSRQIPADRFDVETHYDPTGKDLNKSMTQYGCFIDEPGLFDAPFFNMSPRESQVTDPQMRLSLVTAYEALEQAGYVGNRTSSTKLQRIGTYYGQAADDYREVNQGQEVSTYYIPGGCRAFGPGRINYFFKFAGPSYSIDTACSSGLAAIEVACQALWNGDVDTAVTGGVNVLTNPDGFTGLCLGHFLTKGHNACKTWDSTADGYCRADGVGSLVIKRLQDATADNDNILGVILGAGTNHSAEAVSITHPHAGHQAYLSRQVLRKAGVNPLDVSYVELHGTGTQAGDHEEMQGIMEVYAPITKRRRADQPLHIGAVKANVGHGESVAGTTALIKVLMMLQKQAIPPHIGIKGEINPKFPRDFDKRNLHIPFEMKPWLRDPKRKRMAVVNNFGAAGGNTTMVLEEAPLREATSEPDPREAHVVSVSAKTKVSLSGNLRRLIDYIDGHPDISLADLSYTTTARRYQHSFRVVSASSSLAQLRKQLTSGLDGVETVQPVGKSGPPPVCFAFTGQGASYKSMSLELYRDAPTFREQIHHLDALAQGQGFPSFVPAVDGSHPSDHEHSAVVTQLALVGVEIALAKYWSSLGVKPDVVIGHSLGEYAAMHVAGVTSASDTLFMVGRRAEMLQDKCTVGSHCMVAVRAPLEQIRQVTSDKSDSFTVACINGPSDTVLSGSKAAMDEVTTVLEAAGLRCIKLDVAFAFHSEQTNPILDDFEAVAKSGVIFHEPKLPFISPLHRTVVFDNKTLNAKYVRRATRETVDFYAALDAAQKVSSVGAETVWIEIGPHPVCMGFVKSALESVSLAVPSLRRGEDNWKTMAESLASLHRVGVDVSWNEFHRPFERRLRLLDLPTYAWNDKNYWLQYNGDWCLTKGNVFYTKDIDTKTKMLPQSTASARGPQTSLVQDIVEEEINGSGGTVVMQSDLKQPDFRAAAEGHRMNNCGVVTSSIHADVAYTLVGYLVGKLLPKSKAKDVKLNIQNLVVTKGLVAKSDSSASQVIRVTATTPDIHHDDVQMTWQNVADDGSVEEPFATANVSLGKSDDWLSSWSPIAHLVHSRIEVLEDLVASGSANHFSRNMAYGLFAQNLVDYADKYRGMQSVVMHEFEGFANVRLTEKESGKWTVPPHFIDSVAHLAGFIMNCSDAMDTKNNYCVTPGWGSMRFAKPLVPGASYRSYVKMVPKADEPTTFFGDVYIMQDDVIIGMVGAIKFCRYPRLLLGRFFTPPDKSSMFESKQQSVSAPKPKESPQASKSSNAAASSGQQSKPQQETAAPSASSSQPPKEANAAKPEAAVQPVTEASSSNTISSRALQLIAKEAALDIAQLEDEAGFTELGVDSLMSLVITEKFRTELDVKVGGSLFLDYPTIGDLRNWLEEYYG